MGFRNSRQIIIFVQNANFSVKRSPIKSERTFLTKGCFCVPVITAVWTTSCHVVTLIKHMFASTLLQKTKCRMCCQIKKIVFLVFIVSNCLELICYLREHKMFCRVHSPTCSHSGPYQPSGHAGSKIQYHINKLKTKILSDSYVKVV